MKACFVVVEKDYKNNIFFIEDIANKTNTMTVTNDAEAVFKWIDEHHSHESPTPFYWRVVYKDTSNEWWEMIPTYNEMGDIHYVMMFEKWHGHTWDKLKGSR